MKIILRDLSKSFRDADHRLTVIDQVNFEFPHSGSIGIIGRSGVGKSTLLNLLGGLEKPTSGSVLYDSVDLTRLPNDQLAAFRGKHVGFVFQFHHLLGEFSALENVSMPLLIAGMTESEACRRSQKLLERVGLGQRLSHRPGELSGGEQQRVAIARALVSEPPVILADEPTGNLDIRTAREIQELLVEVNRELGNVLIVVTHLDELARGMGCVLEMVPGGRLEQR